MFVVVLVGMLMCCGWCFFLRLFARFLIVVVCAGVCVCMFVFGCFCVCLIL